MKPHVILHNAMSLDGRMDWGAGDIGLYYELAERFHADAMLSGSNTMLAAYPPEATPEDETPSGLPQRDPHDSRKLLVVVDSRGRIRNWSQIRTEPYWRDAMALCSRATPTAYLDYLHARQVDHIIAGDDHVDLRAALEELDARYGVKVVRVDSGGILNGVLLRAGLVDEVSVIVEPCLVGGTTPRSMFVAPDLTSVEGIVTSRLIHVEPVRGDGIWLRYEIVK